MSANEFLFWLAQLMNLMMPHTQLAAIGKRLSTVRALVRLLAAVAALVSLQRGLTRKELAANGASKVLVCHGVSKILGKE